MKRYAYVFDFYNINDLKDTKYDTKRISIVGCGGERITEMQDYLNDFLKETHFTKDGNRRNGAIKNARGIEIGSYELISQNLGE